MSWSVVQDGTLATLTLGATSSSKTNGATSAEQTRTLLRFHLYLVSENKDLAALLDKLSISSVDAMSKTILLSISIEWICELGPLGNRSELLRPNKWDDNLLLSPQ